MKECKTKAENLVPRIGQTHTIREFPSPACRLSIVSCHIIPPCSTSPSVLYTSPFVQKTRAYFVGNTSFCNLSFKKNHIHTKIIQKCHSPCRSSAVVTLHLLECTSWIACNLSSDTPFPRPGLTQSLNAVQTLHHSHQQDSNPKLSSLRLPPQVPGIPLSIRPLSTPRERQQRGPLLRPPGLAQE